MKFNFENPCGKMSCALFYSEVGKLDENRHVCISPMCAPFDIKDRTPDFRGNRIPAAPDTFWEVITRIHRIYAEALALSFPLMLQPKRQ